LGSCEFKVCARYDAIPGSNNIQNLRVTFEGSTRPPIVLSLEFLSEILEGATRACDNNFNGGEGFVEYVDANGNRNRLDNNNYNTASQAVLAGLNAAGLQEVLRILDKGNCSNWTPQEVAWMIANTAPGNVGGWKIKWRCQSSEGGSGLSVTELEAQGIVRSFTVDFIIMVTSRCAPARNEAVLIAQLSGP
jgi:hypothetical protein